MKLFVKKILLTIISIKLKYIIIKSKLIGESELDKYIYMCNERINQYCLRKIGVKLGNDCNIRQGLMLQNSRNRYDKLIIGEKCFLGKNVLLDLVSPIVIEDNVVLANGVSILTHQDVGDRPLKEFYHRKEGAVTLKEGCYVGANSTILSGITIGKCAVVAAGSVVTRDVESYTVVGGLPARIIKKLIK